MRAKYRRAWTIIDAPLVWKLPNSMLRWCPGTWNSSPGVNRMNSTTAINTGPQSDILLSLFNSVSALVFLFRGWESYDEDFRIVEGFLYGCKKEIMTHEGVLCGAELGRWSHSGFSVLHRWSLPLACDNPFLLAISPLFFSFFFFLFLFNAIPLYYYHVHKISVIELVEFFFIITTIQLTWFVHPRLKCSHCKIDIILLEF